MHYGDLTRAILRHLAESGVLMLDAFFPPHPKARLTRAFLGLDARRYRSPAAARHSLSSILYRLKKEGLVAKSGPDKKSRWSITSKGRGFLERTAQRKPPLPALEHRTLPPKDKMIRLVSFDVPERQRAKRDWLRKELISCDYRPLHRSVYIGMRALPIELMDEITALGLNGHIQIAGIKQKGTLVKDI